MARVRIYPHRTADPASVHWSHWWLVAEGLRESLPPLLTAWDYASDVVLGISLTVDRQLLLESSGLASLDLIQVLVMADCPSAQDRFVASAALSEADGSTQVDLTLRLPAGRVADSVRLSAHLVRSNSENPGEDRLRISVVPVSILRSHSCSDSRGMRVGSRRGVPFSELGLGNASWTILGRYLGPRRRIHGVRQAAHQHGASSWTRGRRSDAEQSHRTSTSGRHASPLTAGAADLFEAEEVEDFDEGSVGAVLNTMCRMLMGQGLRPTVDLYKEDPVRFELVLSDRTNPFGEILT